MDPALAIEVAALSRQKAMNDATALGDSDVQRFYQNSIVFVTGGSGFLGKQLIEKLIRSCDVSKVYMLLRSKKGKLINERLEEILQDPVFDLIRQQQPNFQDKIKVVEGDVADKGLGIKHEDWKTLTEQVDMLFHVAATTKFDEILQVATLINVRGTREAILLGKSCKKLRSFVHVSTAYSNTTNDSLGKVIQEKFYDAPVTPEAMISMAEKMNPDKLVSITKQLIKGWPNTYTFTKSIAEELVKTMSEGLPICIIRPAIVISSYREPAPGWLDMSCVFGASGFLFGGGLGVLHTVYTNQESRIALVPCDYVNNAIIVAGRQTAITQTTGGVDTKIYTVTSTQRNPVTWREIQHISYENAWHIYTPKAVYYVYLITSHRKWIFMLLSLVLHIIPAIMADFVCLILGKPRRFVKTATKAYKMSISLSYFTLHDWNFVDDNLSKLYSSLSDNDRTIFNFDITNINWVEYCLLWCIGVRKYLIKDGLKDTEYADRKQKYLRIVHYLFTTLYIFGFYKLFSMLFYIGSSLLM